MRDNGLSLQYDDFLKMYYVLVDGRYEVYFDGAVWTTTGHRVNNEKMPPFIVQLMSDLGIKQ